jgi:hypothetical protein
MPLRCGGGRGVDVGRQVREHELGHVVCDLPGLGRPDGDRPAAGPDRTLDGATEMIHDLIGRDL